MRTLLATVGVTVLAATHAAAQSVPLAGTVIDSAGAPVAGVPVTVHRISDTGGAVVSETVSGDDGRFTLPIDLGAPGEPLFFVTATYRDELYIGPTFRPPFPEGADYIVQVGLESGSASALLRSLPPERAAPRIAAPATPLRRALLAFVALALVAVGALVARHAFAPPPRRRLLMRIAQLDEHAAEHGTQADPETRARLVERLRTSP